MRVDNAGNLITTLTSNNLAMVTPEGVVSQSPTVSYAPEALELDSAGNAYTVELEMSIASYKLAKYTRDDVGITYSDGGVNLGSTSSDNTINILNSNTNSFRTTWSASSSNSNTITIPTNGSGYNYDVDWGDGIITLGETGDAAHIYSTAGTYSISITGSFPSIYINNASMRMIL